MFTITAKRSVVRSIRIKTDVDEKFQAVHQRFSNEFSDRLRIAGITAERPWTFTDTFERLITEKAEELEKGPSVS